MGKAKNKKKVLKNKQQVLVPGILFVHPKKGFGFVSPDQPDLYPFDIFVPASDLKGALDGDHVLVALPFSQRGGEKRKGVIHKVLSRGKTVLVGTIISLISPTLAMVCVNAISPEVPLKAELLPKRTYKIGDRLLLKTPGWKENYPSKEPPPLAMLEFMGNISNAKTDFPVIKAEFSITEEFPEAVVQEASQFLQKHVTQALHSRKDLRDLLCFTIDSASAKDFDDAVSLTYDHEGNYILGVHIADVSHYVTPNSALDQEAAKRCNSIYFPGKVIPMLPSALSDNLCSLKPNVDRLAVSVFMTFSKEGFLSDYRILRSVIRSKYRMTYDEVDEIIEKKLAHPISKTILEMAELSRIFSDIREQRGCTRLVLPSFTMSLDNLQEPVALVENKQTAAHKLIEEFMLKANEVIAYHISHQGITMPFRIHEPPNEENLLLFRETAKAMGFTITQTPTQEPDYQYLLQETSAGHPLEPILHSQFVRSMKTASYSTENKGHYGLCLDYYTHFTSPIRRYVDLIVHRLLFHPLSVEEGHLEQIVRACSSQERVAAKAEGAFINIKKARFLKKFLDEQPATLYKAFIITVSPEGLSFVLPELCHEGFIPAAKLPKKYVIKTKLGLEELPEHLLPGIPISVQLASVTLLTQAIEWTLIESKERSSSKKKKAKAKSNATQVKKKSSSKKKKAVSKAKKNRGGK
ncbi:ribonuclease R [Chlamydia muridarum str. Nigg]|uniref:Ribonuclease R n=2 Tax=Chlamydia muridarum TaxID=83560 RepID=RNR_CHLMU|nr:ribonuclease R family protein [Chlamydia muridarum]Q9PK00.1 RecName: Full=Ribonuclease R; Short=RNase R; AltName: Full=VacB protein homolog [Chlamydia muridarum str. Nigg]UFT35831.1 VacB/RNase II family 3'-5' exoribonuclease [Chlamydia trachomatis]AAF73588.1 exoribonuclease, VacB/Rnb family [Chlamydia muridarum str. Nigg]AHH23063.1 ribonuclease R [Chlamydia muridarum str. Nigg3 CMUT3-5]AHH23988.1 ribonuclease R [Chlamydia muridarum str. Nigg CM972]AID38195.1 ribonuclease R [Chlamydia murid